MKLLIAAVTFAATLGMLFLIETGKSPKEDYAQIIEALKQGDTDTTSSVAPSPIKSRTPTSTPTLTPVSIPTLSPAPQSSSTARQAITPTPIQTFSSTATPTPIMTPTPTPVPSNTPESTLKQSEKININTAGLGELDNITGVGPVIAQRIIDYRNTNGFFQKIEDIKKVKGIGDITFNKMKDEITI